MKDDLVSSRSIVNKQKTFCEEVLEWPLSLDYTV